VKKSWLHRRRTMTTVTQTMEMRWNVARKRVKMMEPRSENVKQLKLRLSQIKSLSLACSRSRRVKTSCDYSAEEI